jgi:hypothetical protein
VLYANGVAESLAIFREVGVYPVESLRGNRSEQKDGTVTLADEIGFARARATATAREECVAQVASLKNFVLVLLAIFTDDPSNHQRDFGQRAVRVIHR